MARKTAFRTVNVKGLGGTKIVATWSGGTYIDLHWFTADGPIFECINVHDYASGQTRTDVSLSRELTEWVKEHDAEFMATYYRNTV